MASPHIVGCATNVTRQGDNWVVETEKGIIRCEHVVNADGAYARQMGDWSGLQLPMTSMTHHYFVTEPVPIFADLGIAGAVHEEIYGWECPRWFARNGFEQRDHYSFRRTSVHDMLALECKAVRQAAGLMDISSFAKIEVSGEGAHEYLDGRIANRLPTIDGRIILTHHLNERSRIEAELTIVRLGENLFYLTCAAFFEQRVVDWLTQHIPDGANILIGNNSAEYGALALQGPSARDILGQCTDADLSNAKFPWFSSQDIMVGGQYVQAMRMSYAGELGWELHVPMAHLGPVYDALTTAGTPLGMLDTGSFAMNAMRMENAFKGAGELTNEVTLAEADVMRFVKLDKDFIGAEPTRTSEASSPENPERRGYWQGPPTIPTTCGPRTDAKMEPAP